MTPQITEEPSEALISLVELTLKALKKDPLKLTQILVKFTLKSLVHDHSDLVIISLKMLKDSENYVLDLNAVNYADYLNDEFSFLMYSHCLTEKKVIFAVTSVFFNTGKPLMTDED